jgi:trimeric autotransporter adhesin
MKRQRTTLWQRLSRFWDNLFIACEKRWTLWAKCLGLPSRRQPLRSVRTFLWILELEPRCLFCAPVASPDTYSLLENGSLAVSAPGVLANDEGSGLSVISFTQPANGSATITSGGAIDYQPSLGFIGSDFLTYTIEGEGDDCGGSSSSSHTCTGSDTATAGVSFFVNADTIQMTGVPFAVAQGHSFSGTVAVFADDDPDASVDNLSVTIKWGDDTGSSGTVTSLSDGSYAVTGSHSYVEQGPYALGVQAVDSAAAVSGVGVDFVLDVPLYQDSQLQTDSSYALNYSSSVNEAEEGPVGALFGATQTGTLTYTLQTSVQSVDPLQALVSSDTTTTTGVLPFWAGGMGTDSLTAFTLDDGLDYATGTATVSEQVLTGTPASVVSGTQETTDSVVVGGDNNDAVDSSSFSWTWMQTGQWSPALEGTTSDGTYQQTGATVFSTSIGENGDFRTASFSRTEIDSTTATPTLVGYAGPESYTTHNTLTTSTTLTEVGTLGGAFTGTWTGNDTYATTTTTSDAAGSSTATTSGSDDFAQTISASEVPGGYSSSLVETGSSSVTDSGNQEEDDYSETGGGSSTTTVVLTGDTSSGSHTRTETNTTTPTLSETDYDEQDTDVSGATATATTTTTLIGNVVSGSYTQSVSSTTALSDTDNDIDQQETDTSSGTETDTNTLTQTGNFFSSSYSETVTTTTALSDSDNDIDQQDTDTGSTTESDTSTTTQIGNLLSGSYSLTATSTATETGHDTDTDQQDTDTGSVTETDTLRLTLSGNDLNGSYSQTATTTTTLSGTDDDIDQQDTDTSTKRFFRF